jgi:trimeric autotransporter adhesin
MNSFKKVIFVWVLLCASSSSSFGQIVLSGSSYTENFNSLGTATPGPTTLPTGVSVRTGANATSVGTAISINTSGTPLSGSMNTAPSSWTVTNGAGLNVASATGLVGNETGTIQAAQTNRAIAIRQSGSFGDPGAAITFQIQNTVGFADLNLSLALQTVRNDPRETIYTVRYGLGDNPATFTQLGSTYTTSAFNTTPFSATLPGEVNDQNQALFIQIVALSGSTGSGNRDMFAVDDFQLTYAPVPEPTSVLAVAAAVMAGGVGLRRRFRRTGEPAAANVEHA